MPLSNEISMQVDDLIESLNEKNKSKVLKQIHNIVMKDDPKPRTVTVRYSLIKKKFKKKTSDATFLKQIRPNATITNGVLTENISNRDNRKMITITKNDILKIMSFGDSNDIYELAIYLLFVSGRRVSELLLSDFYNKISDPTIQIKGVLKRRDYEDCNFPAIIGKSKFFRLYRKFKTKLKTIKIKLDSFHTNINRKMKKWFPEHNFNVHSLRGIYALYMFTFRNKSKLKINSYIKEVLCHKTIDSSIYYTQYKFDNNFPDFVK